MKTYKTFAYGLFAVILALSLAGCPDPDPTHTHDYGTEWSSNATQHWHECSCGEKTDVANHTGDPCDICGYASGSQNPDICECNGIAEDCDCEDCDCEVCEEEPPVNQPPTANAGTDKTVTLAGNLTITLSGTGADSDGNITAYAWECVSYTADKGAVSAAYTKAQVDALITNANTATATVAPRKAGTYVFKLTVTGDDSESDTDTVTVVVEGYTVQKDVTVSFPVTFGETTLNLVPTYTPVDGWGEHFSVSDITYTVTDNLGNTYDSGTGFNVSVGDGPYGNSTTYIFTQTLKMNSGVVGSQDIRIRVLGGLFASLRNSDNTLADPQSIPSISLHLEKTVNELPPVSANAQAAPTHTLANNLTITLNGTGSTGDITAYAWECVSYTANQGAVSAVYTKAQVDALIANAGTATATVAPRKAGTYVFKLTVTGDEGESDTDTVAVVVEAANVTVNLASFNLPSRFNGTDDFIVTSINLTPTSGTGWDGLDYNKLTFTLSETDSNGNTTTYYNYNNGTVNIPNNFTGASWPPPPFITQTFQYDGKEIGSFCFNLRTSDYGSGYTFFRVYKWDITLDNTTNNATAAANLDAFSPLTLTINEVE